jgi:hypothetical protein
MANAVGSPWGANSWSSGNRRLEQPATVGVAAHLELVEFAREIDYVPEEAAIEILTSELPDRPAVEYWRTTSTSIHLLF